MTSNLVNPNHPKAEMLDVDVMSPDGNVHRMSRPNATDNVRHLGWRFVNTAAPTKAD